MYIVFRMARFNYEKLNKILPKPTALDVETKSITVTYHFGQRLIGGRQIMRVGLIKKSIEVMFDNQITWIGKLPEYMEGEIYNIDAFYSSYCEFKTYPKWMWVKHRKQLMSYSMRYAARLQEKGLFCYETVLGYMYIQNSRLKSRIPSFKILEKKARWITAKMHIRIESGEFRKFGAEELTKIRKISGKCGNKASITARQNNVSLRQEEVKEMLDNGLDVHAIAGDLGVSTRTIYNDMKRMQK